MAGVFVTVELAGFELHFRLHRPKPDAEPEQVRDTPTPMQAYVGFVPTIEHSETFEVQA